VSENRPIPLLVVLGPTGSGKTDLSLCIAHAVGGEIVNCDSVQVYRGFDIGTAKLPAAERQGVPHHLIDIVEPTHLFTAGDYARLAEAAIREICSRGRMPVLVGGTGFYLRGLLEGLSPGPVRDDALRARLLQRERKRPGSLHRILARLDPVSAGRIHPHDKNKTMRALEVRLLEGAPLPSMFERGRVALSGFMPVKIGLDPPRDLLYARLNERARRMFQPDATGESLAVEVRRLLTNGVPPEAKPFESLGYKQVLQMLQGLLTEQQALESTQQETRRYAKRQITWFRKEQDVHWIAGFGDDPRVQAEALAFLRHTGAVPAIHYSQNSSEHKPDSHV
jgi:tRNA dimethylallyltransferase